MSFLGSMDASSCTQWVCVEAHLIAFKLMWHLESNWKVVILCKPQYFPCFSYFGLHILGKHVSLCLKPNLNLNFQICAILRLIWPVLQSFFNATSNQHLDEYQYFKAWFVFSRYATSIFIKNVLWFMSRNVFFWGWHSVTQCHPQNSTLDYILLEYSREICAWVTLIKFPGKIFKICAILRLTWPILAYFSDATSNKHPMINTNILSLIRYLEIQDNNIH